MGVNEVIRPFFKKTESNKLKTCLSLSLGLQRISRMDFINSLEFSRQMDQNDSLKKFRNKFYIPIINGKESIYLNGNSLGLQPKTTLDFVTNALEDWANYGVEGHFHGRAPWTSYHDLFPDKLSKIVGALPVEISVMNQLTINLHLLLTTFYRPSKKRYKIVCEAKAFPSDQYAFESHLKLHGFSYEDAIIEIEPLKGEHVIQTEEIISNIKKYGEEIALIIFGGVNYYTGQAFDMETITQAAHSVGAHCGFDLAHAAGNVPLKLHDWNVDFACWCSYKYLNSGPGGIAGIFIHQRHISNSELPRLAGWWGYDKESRFKMDKKFKPMPTAEGWQVSCTQVLNMAAHLAALNIFDEAGIEKIFAKSNLLTDFLFFIIDEINDQERTKIEIITPRNEEERGCQVSMLTLQNGKELFNSLREQGVLADWREPNVIRVAPVPLYNSFEDVFRFGEILKTIIQ